MKKLLPKSLYEGCVILITKLDRQYFKKERKEGKRKQSNYRPILLRNMEVLSEILTKKNQQYAKRIMQCIITGCITGI